MSSPIAADTGASPAAPSVLITEDVLKNYEAVRADFATFWPAHQLLKDSSTAGITTANVMFSGQDWSRTLDTVRVQLRRRATRKPATAAVFTTSPGSIAIRSHDDCAVAGVGVVQLNKANNHAVAADSTSVAGKNVALVQGISRISRRWDWDGTSSRVSRVAVMMVVISNPVNAQRSIASRRREARYAAAQTSPPDTAPPPLRIRGSYQRRRSPSRTSWH